MIHKSIIERASDLLMADSQQPANTPTFPVVPEKPQWSRELEETWAALRERVVAAGRVA